MQRISDHIDACSRNYSTMEGTFGEVRDSIKALNRLLMGFIGSVFATVVIFAGYSYAQTQTLATQLASARAATAAQVAAIPGKTARAVSATLPPTTTSNSDN